MIATSIDVTTLPGYVGPWIYSTPARLDIKRAMWHALQEIERLLVMPLESPPQAYPTLVLSKRQADAIRDTQEVVHWIKGLPPQEQDFTRSGAMPHRLYGFRVRIAPVETPLLVYPQWPAPHIQVALLHAIPCYGEGDRHPSGEPVCEELWHLARNRPEEMAQ